MAERKYTVFIGKDDIGVYTTQEIHKQFGIEKKNVCKYAYAGTRYRGQFKFVVVPEPRKNHTDIRREWSSEWDTAAEVIREVIEVEKRIQEVWDDTVSPYHRRNNSIWRL